MTSGRVFKVQDLFSLSREALVAVWPVPDRAGINGLQNPSYDDWDELCSGLYSGFVLSAAENCTQSNPQNIPRYGFSLIPTENRWYFCQDGFPRHAFVRFASGDPDLSTYIFRDMDTEDDVTRPWRE